MHSIVDLNESSNATVASKLAAASSGTVGGGQLTSANPRNLVSVSYVSFHAATPVLRYYSQLIYSVWIRVLCNDYFLATVISYSDYFEVIVTLDPITFQFH